MEKILNCLAFLKEFGIGSHLEAISRNTCIQVRGRVIGRALVRSRRYHRGFSVAVAQDGLLEPLGGYRRHRALLDDEFVTVQVARHHPGNRFHLG